MVTAQVTFSKKELIENLQPHNPLVLFGVSWADYEEISEEFGESSPFRITFNKGILTIMPTTDVHEFLTALLHNFVTFTGMALRLNIVPTGRATMRSKSKAIAAEPDASYFVEKAARHKVKDYVPKEVELSPDIVVEIDVHHGSEDKFEIYARFGVSEFWRYDGERLKIFKLGKAGKYEEIERSEQLPVLTGDSLTEFLKRGLNEEQFAVLADFQNWLQENK